MKNPAILAADSNLRVGQIRDKGRHLLPDLIITVHRADDPEAKRPVWALVVEVQLSVDRDKRYTWVEYLASARRTYAAEAEVIVLSPVARVIAWAHGLFASEPRLRPILIGGRDVPVITDPRRALRKPELAVLSAVFHGDSDCGSEVLIAAATAMRGMPAATRHEYRMLLADALPETRMDEIRKLTDDEAQHAADEWLRSRGPYQIGHREGR